MKDILLVSATTFGIQAFVTLFVIMDPPGATPIFLALVKDQPARKRILMAWQGAAVSLIVIVAFAIFGKFILDYLHISVEALQGAGGLLLLLIALELLTGKDSSSDKTKDVNVALVPLGTPLLAGAKVTGKIASHSRGDKVIVFKKRRRKGYMKKQGHRQELSTIQIEAIAG